MTESIATFRIPQSNMAALEAAFEKMAKKAVKMGLTAPTITVTGHEDLPLIEIYDESNGGWVLVVRKDAKPEQIRGYRRYDFIEVHGQAPVLTGWELLGVIEHGDHEVGNVTRTVPGKTLPTEYRQKAGWCDHCCTNRRRLETFVIQSTETSEVRQIGRNCLADFCRDPEAAKGLAAAAEMLNQAYGVCGSAEEDGFGGGKQIQRVGTLSLLACTTAAIKAFGWVSKTKARECSERGEMVDSTAQIVGIALLTPSHMLSKNDKELIAKIDRTETDDQTAEAALEWVRGMRDQAETLGDYMHNLLVVLSDETVEYKHFGIACSAIAAYQRETQQREEKASTKVSHHVGTAGEREVFKGLTVKAISYHTGYMADTATARVRFEDADGNVFIWWTGEDAGGLKEGEITDIKGTVKKHDEFKGAMQTVITRCSVHVEKAKKTRKTKKVS